MPEFTKVSGTHGVYLLPSLTGGGGTFKRNGMEYAIATLPPIRQYLRGIAQRAYARAWGILGAIRTAATSFGEVTNWVDLSMQPGDVDFYIVLTDTKAGQKGALSIEYGRDEYEMERKDGSKFTIGAMTGKFILHRAFGVPPNSLHGTGGGEIPRMSSLSHNVLKYVEMSPVEDLLLALLRSKLPDISVQTLVEPKQVLPFLLIRSSGSWGMWEGDERFIDSATIEVHAFCEGINADEDANLLSEAVRVILRDSKNVVVPGKGYLISTEMLDRPKRSPDWAASVGPVQYADLPSGVERWESIHRVTIRKPAIKPFSP